MAIIKVKGYDINAMSIKDSFGRRAQKYKNNIIESLRSIGVFEDDIYIDLEPIAIKRLPASVSWYLEGFHLHYSYKAGTKYVENLYVISRLIEYEVTAILEGKKDIAQFIRDYTEEHDVAEERKAARELLGVDLESLDLNHISKQYKKMAKDLHPDMPNGDLEKFKAINRAHKILKRELE